MGRIEDKAKSLDAAVVQFRLQQTKLNGTVTVEDKVALRGRFIELEDELNDVLAAEYGVKKAAVGAWKSTHKPLHWFSDFHRDMAMGGFDVIIGNPPYVEYRKVRGEYRIQEDQFGSLDAANLYAFCMERCSALLGSASRFGMIVPAGVLGLDDSAGLRAHLTKTFTYIAASTYAIRL